MKEFKVVFYWVKMPLSRNGTPGTVEIGEFKEENLERVVFVGHHIINR